jgi:eukaryotic-like serine/threonine-protein kinase
VGADPWLNKPVGEPFPRSERFQIRRRLGAGGMGVVYEAFDSERGARVAMKTLLRVNPDTIYRFKHEFRAVQELEHPNLVRLGELILLDGQWFFTMEFLEGTDFLKYVRSGRAVPLLAPATMITAVEGGGRTVVDATRIDGSARDDEPTQAALHAAVGELPFDERKLRIGLRQLALGLHALHRADKVHRDVKPSNIIVTPLERVVLLDFGILAEAGRLTASGDDRAAGLHDAFMTGEISGTPSYLAPEQLEGRVTPAADWYSFGVLLYQALTGQLPFRGETRDILIDKQRFDPLPPKLIGVDLPQDLVALCERLVRRDPAARPSDEEILSILGVEQPAVPVRATGPAPFVGRDGELAELERAFADSRHTWCTVFVHGQSGVGKSELVRRFAGARVQEDPSLVVLVGRCYQRESIPFKAFDGIADALSRFLRHVDAKEMAALIPNNAGLLSELFPVLGRVDAFAAARPINPHPDARIQRARRFMVLRELLFRLAERRPLIVVVDDLQWIDEDSLTLLQALMRPPHSPPLLFLATVRIESPGQEPDEVLPAIRHLEGDVRRLRTAELSLPSAFELLEWMAPGLRASDQERAGAIVREAGGHPLFLQELTRYATESSGRIEDAPRLDEALWARVTDLATEPRRLLEVLCVAGAPIARDVLRHAAGIEYDASERGIELLRAANLLRSTGGHQAGKLEPFHDRITESVTAHLAEPVRRRWHADLARALESAGAAEDDPQVLVRHLEGAGDVDRAAEFAVKAAQRAESALALSQAATLYRLALRLAHYEPNQRLGLLRKLADALINDGRNAEAVDVLLEAAQLAGDSAMRFECQCLAAEKLLTTGRLERGEAMIRELLRQIGDGLPATPRRALISMLWHRFKLRLRGLSWTLRNPGDVPPELQRKLDTYRAVADGFGVVDPIRAADFQTRGLLLALRSGDPLRIGRALCYEACFVATQGGKRNLLRANELMQKAVEVGGRVEDEGVIMWVEAASSVVDFFSGRERRAAQRLADIEDAMGSRKGVARGRKTQIVLGGWEVTTVRHFRMMALKTMGEYRMLRRLYDEFVRDAIERDDLYTETTLRRFCNSVYLADDDVEGAKRALREARWAPPEGRLHVQHYFELRAEIEQALYEGNADTSRFEPRLVALERSLLQRVEMVRIDTAGLRFRLALSAAEGAADPAHHLADVRRVARRLARESNKFARVLHRQSLTALAMQQGDAEAARAHIIELIKIGEAADMAGYTAAARWRYAQLVGGDEGAEAAARAMAWVEAQGIKNVERMIGFVAPGLKLRR